MGATFGSDGWVCEAHEDLWIAPEGGSYYLVGAAATAPSSLECYIWKVPVKRRDDLFTFRWRTEGASGRPLLVDHQNQIADPA